MIRVKRMVQVVLGMALVGSIAGGTMLFAQQKIIPTPAAPVIKPQIAYEILSLSMSGLEWRDTLSADLHFVDQKDNGTVWSLAGRDRINRVLALAPGAMLLPKPTAFEGVPFRLGIEDETKYVSNLEVIRGNDGGIAFKPAIKTLLSGRHVDLRGTLRSDGIQVKGSLEDRELLSFTTQKVTVEGLNPQGQKTRIAGQVQVPDFRIDKVEGEWLIPKEGALLVSLGIRSGHKNILGYGTTTQEHLFLITARQITPKEISDAVAGVKPPASIRPNGN